MKFSERTEDGNHYTGRNIIKLMVNLLSAEGCDDIFNDSKVITVLELDEWVKSGKSAYIEGKIK